MRRLEHALYEGVLTFIVYFKHSTDKRYFISNVVPRSVVSFLEVIL